MSERRPEPFVLALGALRARLRTGGVPLDTRLAATEIATELGLSATPVREALSRLAGEGLLDDRRGEGFFVRRLSRADVAALLRLSLAHLIIAVEAASDEAALADVRLSLAAGREPVEVTEQLFARWAAAGGRALLLSYARLQAQLGVVRRLEGRVFSDLAAEAEALLSSDAEPTERRRRLRAFFARRIRAAGRLADLLEKSHQQPGL